MPTLDDTATLESFYVDLSQRLDAHEAEVDASIAYLGEQGLLDLGIAERLAEPGPGTSVGIAPMAAVVREVAKHCLSSAFSLWAHRMTLDFMARGSRSEAAEAVFAQLRRGTRAGSTAMAIGMKHLAGLGELTVKGSYTAAGDLVLDGFVPWASNLFEGAIMVVPVEISGAAAAPEKLVVWVDTATAGVSVSPVPPLLALTATKSASVKFINVSVPAGNVLSHDFVGFAAAFRATFLLLQSAFCVGLSNKCLEASSGRRGSGDNVGLESYVASVDAQCAEFTARFEAAVADADALTPLQLFQLRLDACTMTVTASRLELSLEGGRGYVAASDAARRFREASFLPVQSPSEGHLRWQVAQLGGVA